MHKDNKMKKTKTVALMVLLGLGMSLSNNAAAFETLGKDCRSYAKAIFAIAEARDNLDEPSLEELKKLHPILKELENTKARAWINVRMINLRLMSKRASPKDLMIAYYESCIGGAGFCLLYGKNCPNN